MVGFIGILRKNGEETYIYDVNYEMKTLQGLLADESFSKFALGK